MYYILLDMEWNQARPEDELVTEPFPFDSDIIEFGAVKLNDRFEVIDEYKSYVKPGHYKSMNERVVSLTRIKTKTLEEAEGFYDAYAAFRSWCGDDYALMTWSTTDISVLMDNMIIYGVDTSSFPDSYDLQRMFGHEISRDDKKWSLEDAVKMLNLPTERAHDALNDAKMTARIAQSLDLDEYLEEYVNVYYNYAEDKIAAYSEAGIYDSIMEAVQSNSLTTFPCPYCGEMLKVEETKSTYAGKRAGYVQCPDGDEFYVSFKPIRYSANQSRVQRKIQLMNDDLWDMYQDYDS